MTDSSYQTFYAKQRWYVGYHDERGVFCSVASRKGSYDNVTARRWAERKAQELNQRETKR